MAGTATHRWSVAALAVLAALFALVSAQGAAEAVGAPKANPNRAIVIIDDGLRRTETSISFSGELSGIEALDAAGASAVLNGFSGLGAAVCSINGVGCSASNCLTCQAPKYWHYLRADNGADTLLPSGSGASTSKVGNCDVEAWIWGSAVGPQDAPDVESICRIPATTTSTSRPSSRPTTTVRPPAAVSTTTVVSGVVPPIVSPSTTTGSGPDLTTTTTDPDGPSTTTDDAGAARSDRGESDGDATEEALPPGGPVDAAPPAPDESSGGVLGLAAVAAVVAGIGLWALVLRKRASA